MDYKGSMPQPIDSTVCQCVLYSKELLVMHCILTSIWLLLMRLIAYDTLCTICTIPRFHTADWKTAGIRDHMKRSGLGLQSPILATVSRLYWYLRISAYRQHSIPTSRSLSLKRERWTITSAQFCEYLCMYEADPRTFEVLSHRQASTILWSPWYYPSV